MARELVPAGRARGGPHVPSPAGRGAALPRPGPRATSSRKIAEQLPPPELERHAARLPRLRPRARHHGPPAADARPLRRAGRGLLRPRLVGPLRGARRRADDGAAHPGPRAGARAAGPVHVAQRHPQAAPPERPPDGGAGGHGGAGHAGLDAGAGAGRGPQRPARGCGGRCGRASARSRSRCRSSPPRRASSRRGSSSRTWPAPTSCAASTQRRARADEVPYGDRMPVSTEQVLHPRQVHGAGTPGPHPARPRPPATPWSTTTTSASSRPGSCWRSWGVGEDDAVAAASGWNGDRFEILGTRVRHGAGLGDRLGLRRPTRRSSRRRSAPAGGGGPAPAPGRYGAGRTERRWQVDALTVGAVPVVRLVDAPAAWTGWRALPAPRVGR